jgi:hypothetical protein
MSHNLGTPVRQIVNPIAGRVVDTIYDKSDECVKHLVEVPGGAQSFWLKATELEVDAEQLAADEAAIAASQSSSTEGEHA